MIKVLQSGLQTSVQDLGRVGFRKFGVPKSGAMDIISAGFANLSSISILLKIITGTIQNPDTALIEFLLSASLFCLAAICVQLWAGFPS